MDDEFSFNFTEPPPKAVRKQPAAKPQDGGAHRQSGNSNTSKPSNAPLGRDQNAADKQPGSRPGNGGAPVRAPKQGAAAAGGDAAKPQQQQRGQGATPGPGGAGKGRPLGKHVGRVKQQAGKERFKRSAGGLADDPDDPDELLRADDPEEADDVAAAMAAVFAREAELQSEAAGRAPAAEREGVVEFDDDGDDGPGARKRRRLAGQHPGGAAAPAPKATGRGNLTPGSLTRAGAPVPAAAEDAGWAELGLASSLSLHLESLSFTAPTPIQRLALPVLLAGRDAMVRAQTGSGKTMCYLLPIINDLATRTPRVGRAEGTHAICVAPTRELCLQIHDVAGAVLKRYHWIVAGLIIGGEHRGHEKARLRKGVHLLAATPGRLMDHLDSTASFKLTSLRWLVLDEADRLLDLGFEAKLKEIIEALDRRRGAGGRTAQEEEEDVEGGGAAGCGGRITVLLSATLHGQLGALAELALREPAVLGFDSTAQHAGAPAGQHAATSIADLVTGNGAEEDELSKYSLPASLRQTWLEVPAKERLMSLAALLRSRTARRRPGGTKLVVFVSSCDGVEWHHRLFGEVWAGAAGGPLLPRTVALFKLHGDMPQAQRTEAFAGFSKEGDGVLICTDVAARGLDFPNVTTIIQYDVPGAPAEYVHRVGRSARMGAAGDAVLFLMPHEAPYAQLLRSRGVLIEQEAADTLARWLPTPPLDAPDNPAAARKAAAAAARSGGGDGAARQLAAQLHRRLIGAVSRDPEAAQAAQDAFRSYVRAYATHSGETKRVFAVRSLHLGHVAHAFCLEGTPTLLGGSGSAADRKRRKREAGAAAEAERRKKMKRAARKVSGPAD